MKTLEERQQDLADFLEKHPHMASYQRAIDQQTEGMDPLKKCSWLLSKAAQRMQDLSGELNKLK